MHSFHFSTDYILENDGARLRPLTLDDVSNLLHFSLHEPELWQYSLVQAGGEEALRHYIRQAVEAREAGREYPFIVFDKSQNVFAGSTRFYDIQLENRTLLLGYTWYGKNHQGTGLNKHCKYLLLQFAFETMGMERVEFRADNANQRSIRAMKSIGCVEEGLLRSHGRRPDGSRRDSIVLSILRNEWFNGVKETLGAKLARV